jgi:hypothetical protein
MSACLYFDTEMLKCILLAAGLFAGLANTFGNHKTLALDFYNQDMQVNIGNNDVIKAVWMWEALHRGMQKSSDYRT